MKKILIIPSWYKDEKSPSAGTFFEEQAVLMAKVYKISIFVMHRFWVEKLPSKISLSPLAVNKVERELYVTYEIPFPQCKAYSPEKNFIIQMAYAQKALCQIQIKYCESWNLIHAYATFAGGCIANAFSKKMSIPYIITEHFGPFSLDFAHSEYIKQTMRTSLEEANQVLSVSSHLKQQILGQNIRCNPIVVGNYVNDTLFTYVNKKMHMPVRLLTVAYYPSYIKDIDTLCMAVHKLSQCHIQVHLTLIGGGEEQGGYNGKNKLEELVKNYNIQNIVTIIGSCTREQMVEQMQKCDIYVSSSIAETFGVSICEAMLCGKPVVITKNGGSNDYVNTRNAKVVDIHDDNQLAKGILEVMNKYDYYNSIHIRKVIIRKYGAHAFVKRLTKIINYTLTKHG